MFFRMDSGETRTIACSSGVQLGDPMGLAMFLPDIATGAEAFQRGVEGGGVEPFGYMDDVPVGLMVVTSIGHTALLPI